MAITTITSVKLPEHPFPHNEVNIIDNSLRRYVNISEDFCRTFCVFMSPRGRHGIHTIRGGISEFTSNYGNGSVAEYGQPLLNARELAAGGVTTLHCIRVTAPDATFANLHIFMRYKIEKEYTAPTDPKDPSDKGTLGKMKVYFVAKYDNKLTDTNNLIHNETAPSVETLEEGWNEIRFMSVSGLGKGKYGNGISIRIASNTRYDKTNDFKNYDLSVWESGTKIEEFRVCLYEQSIINGKSYYITNVVNDDYDGNGSENITIDVNEDLLPVVYAAYKEHINPNTYLTEESFDPLLGIDKVKTNKIRGNAVGATIDGFEFDETQDDAIQLNTVLGTSLSNGNDGSFARSVDPDVRKKAIETAYLAVFGMRVDDNGNLIESTYTFEDILSKNKYPIDFFLDANYTPNVKCAICNWAATRKEDFEVYLDNGTSETMISKVDSYSVPTTYDMYAKHWNIAIDTYYGKQKDPYNYKIVELTSTYNLAKKLPRHWKENEGKHIPYAGAYGIIDSYLPNTVFPLFDESLDADHMTELVAAHVNYAQINSKGDVIRATQTTRYPVLGDYNTMSNLQELNNCHIVLDVKKDVEKMLEDFSYNFNDESTIVIFNRRAEVITQKYAAQQVKSITGTFSRTEEEAEYGILHLTIELAHRPLVKIAIADILVNRNV